MIRKDKLVELRTNKGGTAVQNGQNFAIDLHVADQLEEEYQAQHGEAKSWDRIILKEIPAVKYNVYE